MQPAEGDKSKVITVKVGDRVMQVRRDDLTRLAMGRQLAMRVQWLVFNVHRTDKGKPVDLNRNPQWKQIYADPSPDVVIVASAQVGKSLNGTLRIFAAADLGLETGWVLPTDPKRNEFVHNRIERTIENTPYYKERISSAGGSDSTHEKHYRAMDGSVTAMHFATSASPNELIAFSADFMGIDERDRCDRNNLALAPSRMFQSPYRLTYECSTPTTPGYEANYPGEVVPDNIESRLFAGDYQRMHIPCSNCGWMQVPEWYKHFINVKTDDAGRVLSFDVLDKDWSPGSPQDVRPVCEKCSRPFERLTQHGRWIPKKPGAAIRSYWVNRLLSDVGESLSTIIDKYGKALNNPSLMQQIHNMDLGISYAGGFVGFRQELFARCCEPDPYSMLSSYDGEMATAGIDVNVPYFDVQISKWLPNDICPQRKIHVCKVQGLDNLYALLRRFRVRFAVIDQQPELNLAELIQKEAPTKAGCHVTRAKYSTHGAVEPITISATGENPGDPPLVVTLDRTATIDNLYQTMLNRKVRWFTNFRDVIEGAMMGEMCRPVRTLVIGDGGAERWSWEGKPDHQLHAANYDLIAGRIGGMFLVRYSGVVILATDYTHRPKQRPLSPGGPPEKVLILRGR